MFCCDKNNNCWRAIHVTGKPIKFEQNKTRRVNNVKGTKGQLISKCPFGVFKSPKKPTKVCQGFLP